MSAAGGCELFSIRYDSGHIIAHWTRMRLQLIDLARGACKGALILVLLAAHSGCVYRMNIQQGNFLEARTVDQLQVGMTRSQVRYLLGTPMVPDAFDKERWDYLYYFKKGRWKKPEQRHLIVFFKEEKVEKFDRINIPNKAPQGPDQGPSVSKFPVI
jgi:outer membrane protein assembly factor BamE (lipoprotein component of BamABCDE complex)